jgi:tetratricopeptide (TPR) repeat protein
MATLPEKQWGMLALSWMNDTVRDVLFVIVVVLSIGWVVVRSIQKAEDPARMIFKWVLTGIVLTLMFWKVAPLVGQGGFAGAFGGIPLTAVCGLTLAIIWRHELASLVARPFASLYDGGSTPPEPKPLYSVAQARQKQGKYLEAIVEIRKQLDLFPNDSEGQMLLAQIQAEDLKDMESAEITVDHFCAQPGHAPANIAFALYSLADWHLQINRDTDAAKRALERIGVLLPDSEFALGAAQRLAHLGQVELDPKKFEVVEGPKNLGLMRAQAELTDPDESEQGDGAAAAAAGYIQHLEEHPLDMEAREKLAFIYAGHYGRPDLAIQQFEEMISHPNQPERSVVHWLNLIADVQVRAGENYDTIKGTLERIIERQPNLAAAELARNRIARLRLELKANQQKEPVKMGVYEQNLGLKGARRKRME